MQSVRLAKGHLRSAKLRRIKAHGLKKDSSALTALGGSASGCNEDTLVKVALRVLQGGEG